VCLTVTCTQLAACGSGSESAAWDEGGGASGAAPANSGGAWGEDVSAASSAGVEDVEATDSAPHGECADPCAEQTSCGQICLTMKGAGSSCQLVPTANDLTRPPRSVHFDCRQLPRGPNGWDVDAQGHIALMGDTCKALNKGGPHRVALILGCTPS
jgi:hypothetical protein